MSFIPMRLIGGGFLAKEAHRTKESCVQFNLDLVDQEPIIPILKMTMIREVQASRRIKIITPMCTMGRKVVLLVDGSRLFATAAPLSTHHNTHIDIHTIFYFM